MMSKKCRCNPSDIFPCHCFEDELCDNIERLKKEQKENSKLKSGIQEACEIMNEICKAVPENCTVDYSGGIDGTCYGKICCKEFLKKWEAGR